MGKFLFVIPSFVAIFILNGCDTQQNKAIVQSDTGHEERISEQSEPERWYLASEYQQSRMESSEGEKWVVQCLRDFKFIKPGMTRQEIMRKFPMDGGMQTVSPVRFLHPGCSYFKVDVSFSFERNQKDQNRAILGKDDKVTEVSKPYIEYPITD